jgi:hypothetical protein
MEKIAPLAKAEISRTHFAADVRRGVLGNGKANLHAPGDSGKATSQRLPFDPKGTLVIANRRASGLRAAHGLKGRELFALFLCPGNSLGVTRGVLLLLRQSRFDGFRRFDASCADQLSRQRGVLSAQRIVGTFMQLDAIATLGHKPFRCYGIETGGIGIQRLPQSSRLGWCRIQLQNNCSIHTKTLSYIPR